MKILFVYKGLDAFGNNIVIDNQINSFSNISGVEIIRLPIPYNVKGLRGYFSAYFYLRKKIFKNNLDFDIVHGHYSYSAILGSFLGKPSVCSLMGSDLLYENKILISIVKLFSKYIWKKTIVKSKEMKKIIPNATLIPNGVDLSVFYPKDKEMSVKKVGFDNSKANFLFVAADIHNPVKNFSLAKKAVKSIISKSVILHVVSNKSPIELSYYYNAADALVLTSLSEGSPNVVKEAIACNCWVISTKVGDVINLAKKYNNIILVDHDINSIVAAIEKIYNNYTKPKFDQKMVFELSDRKAACQIYNLYRKFCYDDINN